MINDQKKCFFVHIPGTAGTTVELAINGVDQWILNAFTKHCPMSVQYKYSPWAANHFKFSIVRHPFERIRSLWRFHDRYPFYLNINREIEIDSYYDVNQRIHIEQVPPKTFEYHFGLSHKYIVQPHHREGTVYFNTIDRPYDKIYKYENLSECFDELSERFDIPREKFNQHSHKSEEKPKLSQRSKDILRVIQKEDFEYFGYDPYL